MPLDNRHLPALAKMSAAVMLARIELQLQVGDIRPGDYIEDHAPRLHETLIAAGRSQAEADAFVDSLNNLLAEG
ncbi:hypothetical protein [Bosea sp. ANAM02]|uniref:hypothetical protein n=1 Tax=Bosea sp. ANAM02 TaxID=2020412 RepID=UPI00140EEE07|nr:hypothetical protein [Bosea sp. ANAM02]BCB20283.1 hypothetical protein OCUBac02_31770 [Bosea sp. ANAM02]